MKRWRGFTLIELIIVIVLTMIITGTVMRYIQAGFSGYFTSVALSELSNRASIAMIRMENELRTATSLGSPLSSSQVSFIRADGTSVTYTYNTSNSTLTRAENGGTAYILLQNVSQTTLGSSNAVFYYYDSNGNTTATSTAVKAITISFTLTGTKSNTLPLINTIFLRNT